MTEAHMRRRIHSGRRGRPSGLRPLFVEDCGLADATLMLARSRGHDFEDDLTALPVTVNWTDGGETRTRSLSLPVMTTVQRLGGVRRWWRCPTCNRRRRVLLIPPDTSRAACRRCLRAVYSADYPGRHQWRQMSALLTGFVSDGLPPNHQ